MSAELPNSRRPGGGTANIEEEAIDMVPDGTVLGDVVKWGQDALLLPREIRDGYSIIAAAGQGTYGKVYLAQSLTGDRAMVAVKILSLAQRSDGIPATTLKEVAILKNLKHDNIVELKSVSLNSETFALVFEACESDLGIVLDAKIRKEAYMSRRTVRDLMFQLLKAVSHIHRLNILHRDIKPQNILLNQNETKLKLADFGLACLTGLSQPHEQKNCSAITLWYRPPEMLLGHCGYEKAADMWSVGCVFAEMLLTYTLLNASTEVGQLRRIFGLLRIPPNVTQIFPDVDKLPFLTDAIYKEGPRLEKLLSSAVDKWSIDLLLRMLEIDPSKRITAEAALKHAYFTDKAAAGHIWSFRPATVPSEFEKSATYSIPPMRPPNESPSSASSKDITEKISVERIYRSELMRIAAETELKFFNATSSSI